MTAQRYTDPIALGRMTKGTCPECGGAVDAHGGWGGARCGLTDNGVAERLHQFEVDAKEQAEEDAEPITPSMAGWSQDRDRFLDDHGWDPDDGRG